jgi:hypothetical protein
MFNHLVLPLGKLEPRSCLSPPGRGLPLYWISSQREEKGSLGDRGRAALSHRASSRQRPPWPMGGTSKPNVRFASRARPCCLTFMRRLLARSHPHPTCRKLRWSTATFPPVPRSVLDQPLGAEPRRPGSCTRASTNRERGHGARRGRRLRAQPPRDPGRPRFRGRSRLVSPAARPAGEERRRGWLTGRAGSRAVDRLPAAAARQELEERASTHHVSIEDGDRCTGAVSGDVRDPELVVVRSRDRFGPRFARGLRTC